MSDDREIMAVPEMKGVRGLVCVPDAAIDTMGDFQGLVVGAQWLDGFGPCIFIGTRQKDGTAQIAAIPPVHWLRLEQVLSDTIEALARGDFNKPEVTQ